MPSSLDNQFWKLQMICDDLDTTFSVSFDPTGLGEYTVALGKPFDLTARAGVVNGAMNLALQEAREFLDRQNHPAAFKAHG